jgi:hypothetical protein
MRRKHAKVSALPIMLVGLLALCAVVADAGVQVPISFESYHGYAATVAYLEAVAAANRDIAELREIGMSAGGRPIYVLVLSSRRSGTTIDAHVRLRNPRNDVDNVKPQPFYLGKPALWLGAALAGDEQTGVEACLYTIDALISGHGKDAEITRMLDTKTFYICPTANPDGVASSIDRGMPQKGNDGDKDDDGDGKINEDGPDDLNGDGHITQLRYLDPKGSYVIDDADSRLMVRVAPGDTTNKPRYSVITEDKDNDGDGKRGEDAASGVDLTQSFPEGWWSEDGTPLGAGAYPTSAPEAHALAEFFHTHPNILIAQLLAGPGGATLRPMSSAGPSAVDARDVAVLDRIIGRKTLEIFGDAVPPAWLESGALDTQKEELRKANASKYAIERGYELPRAWRTGYDEAKDKPGAPGALGDWLYKQLGIYALTTSLWNPSRDLGDLLPPVEGAPSGAMGNQRGLLTYQDKAYGGRLFVPWQRIDHPELGAVEVGGWIPRYMHNAFPGKPLTALCERSWQLARSLVGLLPEVTVSTASAKMLYTASSASAATSQENAGEVTLAKGAKLGPYKVVEVKAVIENKGPLATHSARGDQLRGNREDVVWLVGDSSGIRFVQGTPYQRLGVLDGVMPVPGLGARPVTMPRASERFAGSSATDRPRRGSNKPAEVRSGGSTREVTWVVAITGEARLEVIVSSQKGGTAVASVEVR